MALDPQEQLDMDYQANRAIGDILMFEGPFVFFMDLGSVLTMNMDSTIDKARLVLEEVTRIARQHWHWSFFERAIHETTGPAKGGVLDYRRELWINFAYGDDAMLSRITLIDLKGARHADSGGLFISS